MPFLFGLRFGKKSAANQGKLALFWIHFRIILAIHVTEKGKASKGWELTAPGFSDRFLSTLNERRLNFLIKKR